MRRREVLGAAVGGLTLTAGCSGPGDSSAGEQSPSDDTSTVQQTPTETPQPAVTTVEGPAQTGSVTIDAPDRVEAGDSIDVAVTAANIGSEPGDISVTVEFVEGPVDETAELTFEDTQPGERQTRVFSGMVNYSATYKFAAPDYGVSETIEVVPREVQLGEAVPVGDLRVTLTDVEFHDGVVYERQSFNDDEPSEYLLPSAPGNTLAVFRMDVENIGADQTRFNAQNFTIEEGTPISNGTRLSAPAAKPAFRYGNVTSIEGDALAGETISASAQMSGWTLIEVPTEVVESEFEIQHQRPLRRGGEQSETPPEQVWQIDTATTGSVADIRTQITGLSDSIEASTQTTLPVEYENRGSADATAYTEVYRTLADRSATHLGVIRTDVSAGETATSSTEYMPVFTEETTFSFVPGGDATTTVEPARLSLDDSWDVPTVPATVTISDLELRDTLTITERGEEKSYGEPETAEKIAFAFVEIEYEDQTKWTPSITDFNFRVPGDGQVDANENFVDDSIEFVDPDISLYQTEFYEQLGPGDEKRGWIFRTVGDHTREEVEVGLRDTVPDAGDIDFGAFWAA